MYSSCPFGGTNCGVFSYEIRYTTIEFTGKSEQFEDTTLQ